MTKRKVHIAEGSVILRDAEHSALTCEGYYCEDEETVEESTQTYHYEWSNKSC